MATDDRAGGSWLRRRVNRWLNSDLVGVFATIYSFGVLVVSLAVFRYGAPVAGVIVAVGLWVPMFIFAIRERGYPAAPLEIAPSDGTAKRRVLVIANQGLEDPALREEIRRRSGATTDAMIFVPVAAGSRLRELANDIDMELERAENRLESALNALHQWGVHAEGRADIAEPMESLLDGLREFPASEVVIAPGREMDWREATEMAERVRSETGLPVTEITLVGDQAGAHVA